ncbi:hypothetical protein V8G54_013267 [Vigna mungo]|uniref:F-box domain-containing protein n=1 Tax=Vigna mungo TaxID=3915 RepID=A0AAQ3NSN2_VIGMU
MADLISSLPDEIICYILSFLPSPQVIATSVLSKRWNFLWRSVPSLDFYIDNKDFWYSSLCSFLVSHGDKPFYRIRLRCYCSLHITESMEIQIQTALSGSRSVQILDLYCRWSTSNFVIPSVVFSFKTLVTLKLEQIRVECVSFVDLPLLKILHLKNIIYPLKIDLLELLSACPNLEDLKVKRLAFEAKGKFNPLSKLVRVNIYGILLPWEIFKDVEVLKFELVMPICRPILSLNFDFHNLVQLQLYVGLNWLPVVFKWLNHCPKLQSLVISFLKTHVRFYNLPRYEEEDVWSYPETIPACISSHLKTCRLKHYRDSEDEFQFARYILENAKYLQTMKIRNIHYIRNRHTRKEEDMKRKLSSCMERSDTCTLLFE